MSKEKTIGNQNPIQTTINKTNNKLKNILGFQHWDDGVDAEYFINEIIGIEELPYEEFVKEDKEKYDE
jgi:hypothetical protein